MRAAALVAVLLLAGCAHDSSTDASDTSGDPAALVAPPQALALLAGAPSPFARGRDMWEVWTCEIPGDTRHQLYDSDAWRLTTAPRELAAILEDGVSPWFSTISHGAYLPSFAAGGSVEVDPTGGDQECVEAAIALADPEADGVLVVATAAHRPDAPGGWGRPGACSTPCRRSPAARTGRAVYIGASDLDPSWGDRPPLDLVEHELGHALGLPHSGDPVEDESNGETIYSSGIDVMSDSAAPRLTDPERRDAPDTIAANRIALGWTSIADVAVVTDPRDVTLGASTADDDLPRAVVVPLDDLSLLTVELLVPTGANDHLAAAGVAVHLVDQSAAACDPPTGVGVCRGEQRLQVPLVGTPPHTDLLAENESVTANGWVVTVRELSTDGVVWRCRVALRPA